MRSRVLQLSNWKTTGELFWLRKERSISVVDINVQNWQKKQNKRPLGPKKKPSKSGTTERKGSWKSHSFAFCIPGSFFFYASKTYEILLTFQGLYFAFCLVLFWREKKREEGCNKADIHGSFGPSPQLCCRKEAFSRFKDKRLSIILYNNNNVCIIFAQSLHFTL